MKAEYTHLELEAHKGRIINLAPCVDGFAQFVSYKEPTVVGSTQGLLGFVYEAQLSIDGSVPLEPRDIYTLAPGQYNHLQGGSALEIHANKIRSNKITRAQSVPSKPGYTSGTIKVMKDDDEGNVHLIWVDNKANIKKPHYHLRFSEVYFVLEGSGKMQFQDLDGYERTRMFAPEEVQVKPGSFVFIPPKIIHNSVSETGLVIQVVALPTLYKDDIHLI